MNQYIFCFCFNNNSSWRRLYQIFIQLKSHPSSQPCTSLMCFWSSLFCVVLNSHFSHSKVATKLVRTYLVVGICGYSKLHSWQDSSSDLVSMYSFKSQVLSEATWHIPHRDLMGLPWCWRLKHCPLLSKDWLLSPTKESPLVLDLPLLSKDWPLVSKFWSLGCLSTMWTLKCVCCDVLKPHLWHWKPILSLEELCEESVCLFLGVFL